MQFQVVIEDLIRQQTLRSKDIVELINTLNSQVSSSLQLRQQNEDYQEQIEKLTTQVEIQKQQLQIESPQLKELKHELNELYKAQSNNTQRLLSVGDELVATQKLLKQQEDSTIRVTLQLEKEKRRADDALDLVQQKNDTIQLLQDELNTLRLEIQQSDERMAGIKQENQELLNKLLRKASDDATKMNAANNMYESMMEKRQKFTTAALGRISSLRDVVAKNIFSGEQSGGLQSSSELEDSQMPLQRVPTWNKCKWPEKETICNKLHEDDINHVDFSSDGSIVVTASTDKKVKVFDIATKQVKYSLSGHLQSVLYVQVSSNDQLLLGAGNDHSIRLWSLVTGRSEHTLTGHVASVRTSRFSIDCKRVISGSHDRTIKVWDIQRGACLHSMFTNSSVNDLCLTEDSGVISGHVDNQLRFWDLRIRECVKTLSGLHSGQITSTCTSTDSQSVLTSSRDNTLKLVDIRTFEVKQEFKHDNYRSSSNFSKACLSPDGQYVASGGQDGKMYVWKVHKQGQPVSLRDDSSVRVFDGLHQSHAINAVQWSPKGEGLLVSADKAGQIVLWN
ncbi:hypothetical protein MP228_003965 [Amoeboaphelidium protococcarum]|nr:hypothetical protein MP228_003965 [Amoeboaphelidium protococcarum]